MLNSVCGQVDMIPAVGWQIYVRVCAHFECLKNPFQLLTVLFQFPDFSCTSHNALNCICSFLSLNTFVSYNTQFLLQLFFCVVNVVHLSFFASSCKHRRIAFFNYTFLSSLTLQFEYLLISSFYSWFSSLKQIFSN